MDHPKATPKDFFLWAGAMISLYAGVIAFITLVFNYINYTFRDPLQYYSDPYSSGMPYEMASLIVLAPVLLVLMRIIRRNIMADPTRAEVWVRRWALFLTIFAAGATIVVDLIVLLTSFLSGESITTAFLLKVAVVLLVASAGFMHFLADIWSYWRQYPERARAVNYGVGVLVALTILAGFFIVGTPQQARVYRMDEQRVNDLASLQSQLLSFYQQKQSLPGSLSQLKDPTLYYSVPVDPETGAEYVYKKTADLGFQLCATFAANSREYGTRGAVLTMPAEYGVKGNNDWKHGAGEQCFTRSIDPDFFPKPTR